MHELMASYSSNSIFELDFDIHQAHDWWIKRDILYVIHNDGDEIVEYYPEVSPLDYHDWIKYPIEIYLDNDPLGGM